MTEIAANHVRVETSAAPTQDAARAPAIFLFMLTLVLALAFYVPAALRTGGIFPAPLDDVYIHFDYARAFAEGHPFEWISGEGYSSGETAPLYAFVLGVGYLVGFRGAALGWFSAWVAIASVYSALYALYALFAPAPKIARLFACALTVSASVSLFLFFSGMEAALHFACMMHAILIYTRATKSSLFPGDSRAKLASKLGVLCGAMFLLRPESLVMTALFSVGVARAAKDRSAMRFFLRVSAPSIVLLLTTSLANFFLTGHAEPAGAKLKLLASNPYLTDVGRARELALNVFYFWQRVVMHDLYSVNASLYVMLAFAAVALVMKRTRGVAFVCVASAVLFAALVSLNGAARYQNFRYYVPSIELFLVASALGLAELSRHGAWRGFAPLIACLPLISAAPRIRAETMYYTRCAANIREQQVVVGDRIARELPENAIVLVGDAGAIPYVSKRAAIDALGLGGYHGLPFVLAATQGEAATLELVERLPKDLRPTYFALYPNWFPETTARFGSLLFSVTIDDNVICGGPTKGVYRADFSSFADSPTTLAPGVIDEIDIADVVSEKEHAYASPAPDGGWTTLDVRPHGSRARLFDAGRKIPPHRSESFLIMREVPSEEATLVMRMDVDDATRDWPRIVVDGREINVIPIDHDHSHFSELSVNLGRVSRGARIDMIAGDKELVSYHYWLIATRTQRDGDLFPPSLMFQ